MKQFFLQFLLGGLLLGIEGYWTPSLFGLSQAPRLPQAPATPRAPVDCKCGEDRYCGGACGSFCFCSPQKPEDVTSCECEGKDDCVCDEGGCRCSACLERKKDFPPPVASAGYSWRQTECLHEWHLYQGDLVVGGWNDQHAEYRDYSMYGDRWGPVTAVPWKRVQKVADPFVSTPVYYSQPAPIQYYSAPRQVFTSAACGH